MAEGGLEIAEIAAGRLDPATGEFRLEIPGARPLGGAEAGEGGGPFAAGLLGGVVAIGERRESAGAGWCAKAGQRRAVWATAPSLLIEGLEVAP